MLGRARLSGPAGPLIGAAVGLLVGLAVTLLADSTYRADASIVLVRQGQPPGSDPRARGGGRGGGGAVRQPRGGGVGDSEPRPRRDAAGAARPRRRRDGGGQLARADRRRGAEQGGGAADCPGGRRGRRRCSSTTASRRRPSASVWEPASAAEDRVSPKPARNLALGLLIGALVGLALVLVGLRSRGRHDPRGARRSLSRLSSRGRPRRLCRSSSRRLSRAGHPLPRQARSRCRATASGRSPTSSGSSAEQGDAFPEQREELEIYLDSFRSVAGADGRLARRRRPRDRGRLRAADRACAVATARTHPGRSEAAYPAAAWPSDTMGPDLRLGGRISLTSGS